MATNEEDFTNKFGQFQKHYSETDFWSRIKRNAKRLGEVGLRHALTLFYALQEPGVPTWAKTVIIGALGYFIFPLDAIPDFIPVAGLTDDLAVLAAAIGALELNIPQSAREKADAKMQEWLG
ncbi:MAG: DUF1232 domain-containing protein [Desulfomonile sp.]|nr:DUF1232 domain-containing protein [Desulfomonile sp.]